MAKEAVHMEKEVEPEDSEDKGKAMLTRLFETVKNKNTPVIVERIVADIDGTLVNKGESIMPITKSII